MNDETIVAVYDTPAHAELAIQDIIAAGVPESAISKHGGAPTGSVTGIAGQPRREEGFWASLFGGEPDHDADVYDRSMAQGSTVVTVNTPATHVSRVFEILESHSPIDIDERAAGYGLTQATTSTSSTTASMPATTALQEPVAPVGGVMGRTPAMGDETIQLAEEALAVGKRLVNRGGTRIRRFVVETPVEENVSLHSETVTLDRRPVTDGRAVTDADFTDKTIEMTESSEEAVVSKTARVVEEVSLRKQATDRVETVRDTLRKDEVEVVQIPGETVTGGAIDPRSPKI